MRTCIYLIREPKNSFKLMMGSPEKWFVGKVVELAKDEAPELLKL